MRNVLELPRLSFRERDRRWAAVRKEMDARRLDCLVLWGWPLMWDFCIANARYLCPIGGNAEFNVLVFPREGEPTSFVLMPTFLDGWRSAQDWVGDIRARKGTWADSVAARLTELKLDKGRIGMDGLAGPLDPDGWVPHSVYVRLQKLLPGAALIALDDMLEKVRTIKSDEELDILAKAAEIGDLMLAACRDTAQPGVKECEVYGRMMETMIAHGAVSVGLRPPSLSASVSRADHAQARTRRRHHLRNPSEDRRLFHPRRAHVLPRRAGSKTARDL